MAIPSNTSTWILSLKFLLITSGVVSIAFMMNFSVPLIINFMVYQVPLIWSVFVSWLRPPYLYFVINFIIITIAATSRFHHRIEEKTESEPLVESKPPPPPSDLHSGYAVSTPPPDFGVVESPAMYESEAIDKSVVLNGPVADQDVEREEAFVVSRSTWTPPQRIKSSEVEPEYLMPSPEVEPEYIMPSPEEKPLVSSRFGHRRPLKSSPEGGRALRVAKSKRHETFDTTWRMITDGRHVPLMRHLRKSDTWENHGRHFTADQSPPPQIVSKSETFRDRTNYDPLPTSANSSPGSGKLRKEPSLSQDELNRRVEAFIKKFNDEMRLQRQESLNKYMEMINRGAH